MIDRSRFDLIKKKHGTYASWAVWAEPSLRPKSNVGDLRVLDPDQNPGLLQSLRSDVVMLGLNISRPFAEPFRNFHDASPRGQDYRIRHAFDKTPYHGAYMTDLVKNFVMLKSGDMMREIESRSSLIEDNVRVLLSEFDDLGSTPPLLIAFGNDAHRLAGRRIPADRYSRLVGVVHYSHYLSKETYRERVLSALTAPNVPQAGRTQARLGAASNVDGLS